jgi:hypothetical protein
VKLGLSHEGKKYVTQNVNALRDCTQLLLTSITKAVTFSEGNCCIRTANTGDLNNSKICVKAAAIIMRYELWQNNNILLLWRYNYFKNSCLWKYISSETLKLDLASTANTGNTRIIAAAHFSISFSHISLKWKSRCLKNLAFRYTINNDKCTTDFTNNSLWTLRPHLQLGSLVGNVAWIRRTAWRSRVYCHWRLIQRQQQNQGTQTVCDLQACAR